jgi:hypothetical protein
MTLKFSSACRILLIRIPKPPWLMPSPRGVQPQLILLLPPHPKTAVSCTYTLAEKSEVTTRSLCAHVKLQRGTMDAIMKQQAKSDISKFNDLVNAHLLVLRKHKQELMDEDLINFLFKGYLSCSDSNFVRTMELKKDQWELDKTNITPMQLMTIALNKYETRKLEKAWNKPSAGDAEIVALKAQIKKLSKARTEGNTTTSFSAASVI